MTSHEILKADVLDILFESRNKQYGAYTLRKGYNARLCKALAIALSTMLLLLFLFQPGMNESAYDEEGNKDVKVITLDPIPKIPKPPIKPMPPPPKAAQSSYVQNIKMVQNPDPKTEMKPVEEIKLTG